MHNIIWILDSLLKNNSRVIEKIIIWLCSS